MIAFAYLLSVEITFCKIFVKKTIITKLKLAYPSSLDNDKTIIFKFICINVSGNAYAM